MIYVTPGKELHPPFLVRSRVLFNFICTTHIAAPIRFVFCSYRHVTSGGGQTLLHANDRFIFPVDEEFKGRPS